MGKQTQEEIAKLKEQIARLEANETVEDVETAFTAFKRTPKDSKVQDSLYSAMKRFTNQIERAKKIAKAASS